MEIGKMGSFIKVGRTQVWVNFSYSPKYVCFNYCEDGIIRVRLFEPNAFDVYDERWR